MNWDEVRSEVQPAIVSKVEEFHLYGFNRATEDEVWECMRKKKWKRDVEPKPIRELVNDILRLSASDYMGFITLEAYKAPFQYTTPHS